METNVENDNISVLDATQLTNIESVHRGFLYQHLYAVGCLFLAQAAGVDMVMVELDEDIELSTQQDRIYVQVKTRSKPIVPSDISSALARFDKLREEHTKGNREGKASFVIVANQVPSVRLQRDIDEKKFPDDVLFVYPNSTLERHAALPPAWDGLTEAAEWCINKAEELHFSLLTPESLIWKLAGLVQLAATGSVPDKQHAFHVNDLSELFEQLIVQLQDFPAPAVNYRPQQTEPSFTSDDRVRIVCGLSGAGKTAWAAQAALHYPKQCAYYDTGDLPGPALASTLVRELAAKLAISEGVELRKILLPGATGYEALRAFDTFLEQSEINLLLVVDNAHRIPVLNLRDVLNATKCISFVLLCQPHDNVRELEAETGIKREALLGWDIDTVAAVVVEIGGFATAQGFDQLRVYTGGLPLYVQSAANIAIAEYKGNMDILCAELHRQENTAETAQEVILSRVFQNFDKLAQESLAVLSLSDVGLLNDELFHLLSNSLDVSRASAVAILKKLRGAGAIEVFGNQKLKVHDALRAVGLHHLELMEHGVVDSALTALKEVLIESMRENRDASRFSLLTQVYIKLNDVMTLISISGEEIFHEMGINIDIFAHLERAANSDSLDPLNKFWALDGLVFSELRAGSANIIDQRLEVMDALLRQHQFGFLEEIAYVMKRILFSAENGDADEVLKLVEQVNSKFPDAEHERIFDYNHALALWKLKKYSAAEELCKKVMHGYYALLGIQPHDVLGKNSDVLWIIINRPENVHDHLKHLADSLELYALIRNSRGRPTHFARIHAMKFYNMAGTPDSMVRVGQDLADEFAARKDFVGARDVLEQMVLPVVKEAGLIRRLVQVRSQYAVILALCGKHGDAEAEMRRLEPYTVGLNGIQLQEIENQRNQIATLASSAVKVAETKKFGAVGRNEKCPCGSGLKYKKCHGVRV